MPKYLAFKFLEPNTTKRKIILKCLNEWRLGFSNKEQFAYVPNQRGKKEAD